MIAIGNRKRIDVAATFIGFQVEVAQADVTLRRTDTTSDLDEDSLI